MELINKATALELLDGVVEETARAYKDMEYVSYIEVAKKCRRLIAGIEPEKTEGNT